MIVIATNNGKPHLQNLLNSLLNTNTEQEDILIVDTISDDEQHLEFLNDVCKLYPSLKLEVTTTPYRNFDTGAYIHAYKNYKAGHYIFLHDSITIKNSNFITDTMELLSNNQVVVFSYFDFIGEGDSEWKTFFKTNTGENRYEMGIFGPMFACNRSALDMVALDRLLLPVNKNQQACFEGIWPTIFKSSQVQMLQLDHSRTSFYSRYIDKKIIHRD